MPRPQPRAPRTQLDETAAAAPDLTPAPDNGVPYGTREPAAGGRQRKPRGRQLGHRIPDELYARLVACSEDTGITQQRLIIRGIDEELKRHGH